MCQQAVSTRKEAYLKSGGAKCPVCSSESIEAHGSVEVNGESAHLAVSCNDCDATWDDAYTLSGIENAQGFDPNELVYSKEIALDYGIAISVDSGGGRISSKLIEQLLLDGDSECEKHRAEGASDALESFLLALAAEGVDMETPRMKNALKTAVESIGQNAFMW